jgi:hypothetical protein
VIGISIRKSVVMAVDIFARTSSQVGPTSDGVHSSDRTVYPRSASTQVASITIYDLKTQHVKMVLECGGKRAAHECNDEGVEGPGFQNGRNILPP